MGLSGLVFKNLSLSPYFVSSELLMIDDRGCIYPKDEGHPEIIKRISSPANLEEIWYNLMNVSGRAWVSEVVNQHNEWEMLKYAFPLGQNVPTHLPLARLDKLGDELNQWRHHLYLRKLPEDHEEIFFLTLIWKLEALIVHAKIQKQPICFY